MQVLHDNKISPILLFYHLYYCFIHFTYLNTHAYIFVHIKRLYVGIEYIVANNLNKLKNRKKIKFYFTITYSFSEALSIFV